MATKRIEERFKYVGGKVRREGPTPVVEGVLLCGPTSANGRDYLPEAFAGERVKRYEGRPVRLNHANQAVVERKLATIRNARLNESGLPIGDLHVNPEHAFAKSFLWAAEHDPDFYGMSHVAHCDSRVNGSGREQVCEIGSVESVDVVDGAATTKGLFRHEQEGFTVPKIKLPKLLEWLTPRAKLDAVLKLKSVVEMDGMSDADVAEPGDGTDPGKAIESAFYDALHKLVDTCQEGKCESKDFLAKAKIILTAAGKIAADTEAPKPADEAKKTDTATAFREAMDVCAKVAFKGFTTEDIETIAAVPAAKREAVAGKLKLASVGGAETPSSGAQGAGVPDSVRKEAAGGGNEIKGVKWEID